MRRSPDTIQLHRPTTSAPCSSAPFIAMKLMRTTTKLRSSAAGPTIVGIRLLSRHTKAPRPLTRAPSRGKARMSQGNTGWNAGPAPSWTRRAAASVGSADAPPKAAPLRMLAALTI